MVMNDVRTSYNGLVQVPTATCEGLAWCLCSATSRARARAGSRLADGTSAVPAAGRLVLGLLCFQLGLFSTARARSARRAASAVRICSNSGRFACSVRLGARRPCSRSRRCHGWLDASRAGLRPRMTHAILNHLASGQPHFFCVQPHISQHTTQSPTPRTCTPPLSAISHCRPRCHAVAIAAAPPPSSFVARLFLDSNTRAPTRTRTPTPTPH